jgi:hypothetical protein
MSSSSVVMDAGYTPSTRTVKNEELSTAKYKWIAYGFFFVSFMP